MKYFLKSSVSILVLLSIFATLSSSQAGNSGNGGEKPEETFDAKILVPFKGRPKSNIQAFYKSSDESTVHSHFLPLELWQQIFAILDYDGIVSVAQVRKHWRWIILEDEGRLNWLSLHPSNAFCLYEQVLPFCPSLYLPQEKSQPYFEVPSPTLTNQQTHCVSQSTQTATPCIDSQPNSTNQQTHCAAQPTQMVTICIDSQPSATDQQTHFRSQSIQTITTCTNNDPFFRDFLGRIFVNLNPSQDFKEVCFASLIIKNSEEMRTLLKNIVGFHAVDFENLPEKGNLKNKLWQLQGFRERTDQDLEHFHNFQPFQQSLMALKLLALTGDHASLTKLQAFKTYLNSLQVDPRLITSYEDHGLPQNFTQAQTNEQHHLLINHPNWAAYIDDFPLLHTHFFDFCGLLQVCPDVKVDPEIIKSFGQHYFDHLKNPSADYKEPYYPYLLSLLMAYERLDNPLEILKTIKANYPKLDFGYVVRVANSYSDERQYGKAIFILQEAYQSMPDNTSLTKNLIGFEMARYHLLLQDQAKFPQTRELIQLTLEKFNENDVSLEIPTSSASTRTLYKHDVLFSKAALCIYDEKFEEAYLILKKLYENPEIIINNDPNSFFSRNLEDREELLEAVEILVPAVQMQQHNPAFSKELFTLISQKVHLLFFKKDDLDFPEDFVIANKDVLNFILKDYPEDCKIVKAMTEI